MAEKEENSLATGSKNGKDSKTSEDKSTNNLEKSTSKSDNLEKEIDESNNLEKLLDDSNEKNSENVLAQDNSTESTKETIINSTTTTPTKEVSTNENSAFRNEEIVNQNVTTSAKSSAKATDKKYPGMGYIIFVKSAKWGKESWFECGICAPEKKMAPKEMTIHLRSIIHLQNLKEYHCPELQEKHPQTNDQNSQEVMKCIMDFESKLPTQTMVAATPENVVSKRNEILEKLKTLKSNSKSNGHKSNEDAENQQKEAELLEFEIYKSSIKLEPISPESKDNSEFFPAENNGNRTNTSKMKIKMNLQKTSILPPQIQQNKNEEDKRDSFSQQVENLQKSLNITIKTESFGDTNSEQELDGNLEENANKESDEMDVIEAPKKIKPIIIVKDYNFFQEGFQGKFFSMFALEVLREYTREKLNFDSNHAYFNILRESYLKTLTGWRSSYYRNIHNSEKHFLFKNFHDVYLDNGLLSFKHKPILPLGMLMAIARLYHENLRHPDTTTLFEILSREFFFFPEQAFAPVEKIQEICDICKATPPNLNQAHSFKIMEAYNDWPNKREMKALSFTGVTNMSFSRSPTRIAIISDERDSCLKHAEQGDVSIRICPGLNLENAYDFISCDPLFGTGVLFVVLAGTFNFVKWEIDPDCRVKQCSEPLLIPMPSRQREKDIILEGITAARNLHQAVMLNSNKDDLIFGNILPISLTANCGYLSSRHSQRCKHFSTHPLVKTHSLDDYINLCTAINHYNGWTDRFAQELGYEPWNAIADPFFFDSTTTAGNKIKKFDLTILTDDGVHFASHAQTKRIQIVHELADVSLYKMKEREKNGLMRNHVTAINPQVSRLKSVHRFEKILIFCEADSKPCLDQFASSQVMVTDAEINPGVINQLATQFNLKECNSLWIFTSTIRPIAQKLGYDACSPDKDCPLQLPFLVPRNDLVVNERAAMEGVDFIMKNVTDLVTMAKDIVGKRCVAISAPVMPVNVVNGNHVRHDICHELYNKMPCVFISNTQAIESLLPIFEHFNIASINLCMKLLSDQGLYPLPIKHYMPRYKGVFRSIGSNMQYFPFLPFEWEIMMKNLINTSLHGFPLYVEDSVKNNLPKPPLEYLSKHLKPQGNARFNRVVFLGGPTFSNVIAGFNCPLIQYLQVNLEHEKGITTAIEEVKNFPAKTLFIYLESMQIIVAPGQVHDVCMKHKCPFKFLCTVLKNEVDPLFKDMDVVTFVEQAVKRRLQAIKQVSEPINKSSFFITAPICPLRGLGLDKKGTNVSGDHHAHCHNNPPTQYDYEYLSGTLENWQLASITLDKLWTYVMESNTPSLGAPYKAILNYEVRKESTLKVSNNFHDRSIPYSNLKMWQNTLAVFVDLCLSMRKDGKFLDKKSEVPPPLPPPPPMNLLSLGGNTPLAPPPMLPNLPKLLEKDPNALVGPSNVGPKFEPTGTGFNFVGMPSYTLPIPHIAVSVVPVGPKYNRKRMIPDFGMQPPSENATPETNAMNESIKNTMAEANTDFRIMVGKIDLSISDLYINMMLSVIGDFLMFEKPKVMNASYGVAKFSNEESAERCVRVLHNYPLRTCKLEVKYLYYRENENKQLDTAILSRDEDVRKLVDDIVFKVDLHVKNVKPIKIEKIVAPPVAPPKKKVEESKPVAAAAPRQKEPEEVIEILHETQNTEGKSAMAQSQAEKLQSYLKRKRLSRSKSDERSTRRKSSKDRTTSARRKRSRSRSHSRSRSKSPRSRSYSRSYSRSRSRSHSPRRQHYNQHFNPNYHNRGGHQFGFRGRGGRGFFFNPRGRFFRGRANFSNGLQDRRFDRNFEDRRFEDKRYERDYEDKRYREERDRDYEDKRDRDYEDKRDRDYEDKRDRDYEDKRYRDERDNRHKNYKHESEDRRDERPPIPRRPTRESRSPSAPRRPESKKIRKISRSSSSSSRSPTPKKIEKTSSRKISSSDDDRRAPPAPRRPKSPPRERKSPVRERKSPVRPRGLHAISSGEDIPQVPSPPKMHEIKISNVPLMVNQKFLNDLVAACGSPSPCKKDTNVANTYTAIFSSAKRAVMVTQHLNNWRIIDKVLKVEVIGDTKGVESQISMVEDTAVAKEIESVFDEFRDTFVIKIQGEIMKDPDIFTFKIFKCGVDKCREYDCHYYHTVYDRRRDYLEFKYSEKMCSYIKQEMGCPKGEFCNMCHNSIERVYHPKNYKTNVCLDWYEMKKCPKKSFCAKAHPMNGDAFFTEAWKDMFIAGLDQSFFFFAGAIKMLYKVPDNEGGVPIVFVTTLPEIAQFTYEVAKPVAKIHRLKIAIITDTQQDPAGAHILIGTPSGLANLVESKGSAPLGGLRVLILDDITTLINNPYHQHHLQFLVESIYSEVGNKKIICRIATSETCHPSEIKNAEAILKTELTLHNPHEVDCNTLPAVSITPLVPFVSNSPKLKKKSKDDDIKAHSSASDWEEDTSSKKSRGRAKKKASKSKKRHASSSRSSSRSRSSSSKSSRSSSSSSRSISKTRKQKRSRSTSKDGGNENASGISSEITSKMKRDETVLQKEHDAAYDVYLESPEMHPMYEDKYDRFLQSYKKKYNTTQESDHLTKMWHKYWKLCLESIKAKDWKKKKREIVERYHSKPKEVAREPSYSPPPQEPAKPAISRLSSAAVLMAITEISSQSVEDFSVGGALEILNILSDKIGDVGGTIKNLVELIRVTGINTKKGMDIIVEEPNILTLNLAFEQILNLCQSLKGDQASYCKKGIAWGLHLIKYAKNFKEASTKTTTPVKSKTKKPVRFDLNLFAQQTYNHESNWIYSTLEESLEYVYGVKPDADLVKQMFANISAIHLNMSASTPYMMGGMQPVNTSLGVINQGETGRLTAGVGGGSNIPPPSPATFATPQVNRHMAFQGYSTQSPSTYTPPTTSSYSASYGPPQPSTGGTDQSFANPPPPPPPSDKNPPPPPPEGSVSGTPTTSYSTISPSTNNY